jgi:hypothetical protein
MQPESTQLESTQLESTRVRVRAAARRQDALGEPEASGPRVAFTALDFPCVAEERDGVWTVTVASAAVGRAPVLALAIREATGGLVGEEDARQLAVRIDRAARSQVVRDIDRERNLGAAG